MCDAFHAEIWGMYLGLDMAWRDTTHLIVDNDSKILVDMITENCNFSGTVKITHTWREGNRSADWLTNFSISMDSLDFHILETPPTELQSLLFDDIFGLACLGTSV